MKSHVLSLVAAFGALSLVACAADSSPDEPSASVESAIRTSGFLSGSTYETGYYVYPARSMFFGAPSTCQFGGGTISVQALDVPNRFTVRDAYGNFVTSTPWLGNATYSGPWGSSLPLSNPSSATLSIATGGSYTLVVETSAQLYGMNDAWEASYSSRSVDCVTTTDPGTSSGGTTCVSSLTGSSMSGSAGAGLGYYVYPDRTFNVSFCTARTLTVRANALDVPNRVNVYDPSGNLVGSTGWLGTSSSPGPWGMSLSNSGSGSVSFLSKNGTYRVRVETVTSDRTDYWDATVF